MAARYPWWKTTLKKKKDPVPKVLDSEANADDSAGGSEHTAGSQGGHGSSLISEETYDDSREESAFNEHTSRRNLRVSRSGRFKEKRRTRVTLPENNNFHTATTAVAK